LISATSNAAGSWCSSGVSLGPRGRRPAHD
jgi:hypothetical protein